MGGERADHFFFNIEFFLVVFPQNNRNRNRMILFQEFTSQIKTRIPYHRGGSIGFSKIALCKTEIVYGIQKIGLPRSVHAANGNDPVVQVKVFLSIIPELGEADMVDPEQNIKEG